MLDYYTKVSSMTDDKIITEIQNLQKKLYKIHPESPMYSQMLELISIAQNVHEERLFKQRFSNVKDEVVDIGEIEEVVYTPNYDADDLLRAVVELYRKK